MNDINWLSMALGSVMPFAMGWMYYHKAAFGKAWQDSIGVKMEQMTGLRKAVAYLMFVLVSFLLSFFLLNFNNAGIDQEGNFDNFPHGAWHGLFIAITVAVPIVVINGLLEQKKAKHILIHILYWIITIVLMGGMLDAMNHWENIPMPEGY